MDAKQLVEKLMEKGKTISSMESCTGGGLANAVTNVKGASEVLKYSAVTYSQEFKIKMGVSKEIIDKYSVYSRETADEMSFNISVFADSSYGVGITGKLSSENENNLYGEDNVVFISIYDKEKNKFYNEKVEAIKPSRKENKKLVIDKIIEKMIEIL